MDKNTFEVQCCEKIQEGYRLLVEAIRSGEYSHPDKEPPKGASKNKREQVFLEEFKRDASRHLENRVEAAYSSFEALSMRKRALLLSIHIPHVPKLAFAAEAIQALSVHNTSERTNLPDGSVLKGNKGLVIKLSSFAGIFKEPEEAISFVPEITARSALAFDPERGGQYTSYFGDCLARCFLTLRKQSKRQPKLSQGDEESVLLKNITLPTRDLQQELLDKLDLETIRDITKDLIATNPKLKKHLERMQRYYSPDDPSYEQVGKEFRVVRDAIRQSVVRALSEIRKEAQRRGRSLD